MCVSSVIFVGSKMVIQKFSMKIEDKSNKKFLEMQKNLFTSQKILLPIHNVFNNLPPSAAGCAACPTNPRLAVSTLHHSVPKWILLSRHNSYRLEQTNEHIAQTVHTTSAEG